MFQDEVALESHLLAFKKCFALVMIVEDPEAFIEVTVKGIVGDRDAESSAQWIDKIDRTIFGFEHTIPGNQCMVNYTVQGYALPTMGHHIILDYDETTGSRFVWCLIRVSLNEDPCTSLMKLAILDPNRCGPRTFRANTKADSSDFRPSCHVQPIQQKARARTLGADDTSRPLGMVITYSEPKTA